MLEQHFELNLHPFFLNSVPKAGTHLIKQILIGMPSIKHDPANHMYEGLTSQLSDHKKILTTLGPNEFASGHIYYSEEWTQMLSNLNMKQIFMIRDPRDVLVSFYYYLDKLPHFNLYKYMEANKLSKKEKILSIINGVQIPEVDYPDIKTWFNLFRGWMYNPFVLNVRFEELHFSNESARLNTIRRIVAFLMGEINPIKLDHVVNHMIANIAPVSSPTFRKGAIGNWKTEFDEEIKQAFKDVTGNLLIEMNYEKTMDW